MTGTKSWGRNYPGCRDRAGGVRRGADSLLQFQRILPRRTAFYKSPAPIRLEHSRQSLLRANSQLSPRYFVREIVGRACRPSIGRITTEHAGFDSVLRGRRSINHDAGEYRPHWSLALTESAGLRPRAADGLPVLGPCAEIEGVYYATGHYRNGILLAPVTADLIAEAIVNKVISRPLSIFSPDRFRMAFIN